MSFYIENVLDFALNISDHQLLRLLELNSWQLLRLLQAQSTYSTCESLKDTPSCLFFDAAARHRSWKSKNDFRWVLAYKIARIMSTY